MTVSFDRICTTGNSNSLISLVKNQNKNDQRKCPAEKKRYTQKILWASAVAECCDWNVN